MSVSIVVPCYNVAPYVEECLESLVNQSLQDLEIICVNDGSTDATPALLDAWARRDGRIRVIHRENGGQASARNVGMDTAAGEYVGFVDPDDYVEHAMFARLVEESRRHGADVTACGYTSFSDGDGSVLEELSWSPAAGVEKEVQSSMARAGSVWERMDVVTCNKLYRRDFLNRHGLRFETSFRSMEDDVLWLMALAHAWPSFRTVCTGTAAGGAVPSPRCWKRRNVPSCWWRNGCCMLRSIGKNAAGWNPAWSAAGYSGL